MNPPRCRPGDVAIVVSSFRTPNNLGAYVTVLRELKDGEYWAPEARLKKTFPTEVSWLVRSAHPLDAFNRHSGKLHQFNERPYADACLHPIRPPNPEEALCAKRELENQS